MLEPDILPSARALAGAAGLGEIVGAEMLKGGANNRAYRLDCRRGQAMLKHYFRTGVGERDRLGAEFAFAKFAWIRGIRCLAQPLARDTASGLALYAFLPGRPLAPGEVSAGMVRQALDFLLVLNRHRRDPGATAIGSGAEACFSIVQHLQTVGDRVARLGTIDTTDELSRDARAFALDVVIPLWHVVENRVSRAAVAAGLSLERPLPAAERCLSPSDFGFHNALLGTDGMVYFIDFEYAGWDDPAKMVGDFFNQVAVPVPTALWQAFAPPLAELSFDPPEALRRMELLLPVYSCKWACIVLNEFLPENAERRRFAGGDAFADRRAGQLVKARRKIEETRETFAGISL